MKAAVHFLHSGQGDTILIQGGEEWGIVDAHFVEKLDVRKRAKELLSGVKRLRFVCITHFDLDHIRGLGDFLREEFSDLDDQGRRTWRIEQVITPLDAITPVMLRGLRESAREFDALGEPLLEGDYVAKSASALLNTLCDMLESSPRPDFPSLPAGLDLKGPHLDDKRYGMGPWRIVCLGPRDATRELFSDELRRRYRGDPPLRELRTLVSQNDTSRVLALQHAESRCVVLLTGDSTKAELREVVKQWKCLGDLKPWSKAPFHIVKVSHHGAEGCHVSELYDAPLCQPERTHAVILSRDEDNHPHPEVIADLTAKKVPHRVTGSGGVRAPTSHRARGLLPGYGRGLVGGGDIELVFDGREFVLTGGKLSCHAEGGVARE